MCDHSGDPGGREAAMIVLDPGTPERHGRDGVWCDPCIAPLVKALNDAGIRTVASCCGHGTANGNIMLGDGRELLIAADFEAGRAFENSRATALDDAATVVMDGYKGQGHCSACDIMALKDAELRALAKNLRWGITA
jgi:hypothetical protein